MERNPGQNTHCRECLPSVEPLKTSYYHGACACPLSCQTIGELLEEAANTFPNQETFLVPEFDQSLTRNELLEKASRLSYSLLQLGIQQGDKVGVIGVSDIEYFVIFFAATQIGGIVVALSFVFVGRSHQKESIEAIEDFGRTGGYSIRLVEVNTSVNDKYVAYTSLFNAVDYSYERLQTERKHVNVESPAIIISSSGSVTGHNKAVCVSHGTLVNTALFTYERLAPKKGERVSILNPINEEITMTIQMLQTVCHDRVAIVAPIALGVGSSADEFLAFIEKERVNWHAGHPFEWLNAIKTDKFKSNKYNVTHLRGGQLVGQAFTYETRKALIERFPDMIIMFGATEALAGMSTSAKASTLDQKLTSVGYPLPHCEVKIVNESGAIVPTGSQGEICLRGWPVFTEYLNDERLTLSVKRPSKNGWYHYGDIGIMDETGHVRYIGRKSDCIRFKHYTEAVYPESILTAIAKFEKIKNAKVIGIPNEIIGDDIVLCVEPHEGVHVSDEEVRAFLEGTNDFLEIERPDYYFVFEQLPRTGGRRKISSSMLRTLVETKLRALRDKTAE